MQFLGRAQKLIYFSYFFQISPIFPMFSIVLLITPFLSLLNFFFLTFGSSSSFPSACLSHLQFLSDGIKWYSFFLKCFHPCLQDLNNSLTQFISGCCCLAVLQEATVAPVLVTNRGKCKVRKVFGSVTFNGCGFLEYVQGSSSLGHFCMESLWYVYL